MERFLQALAHFPNLKGQLDSWNDPDIKGPFIAQCILHAKSLLNKKDPQFVSKTKVLLIKQCTTETFNTMD